MAASWIFSPAASTASPVACDGVRGGLGSGGTSGVDSGASGVGGGASGVNGGASGVGGGGSSSLARGGSGVGSGVGSLASGGSGVGSGLGSLLNRRFLLGAAGQGEGGEGGSECDLGVHVRYYPETDWTKKWTSINRPFAGGPCP